MEQEDTPVSLKIEIYLADGTVARFQQVGEAEQQQILNGIIPARLYTQPSILIGGGYSASLYPSSAITHIAFTYPKLPNWADLSEETELTEVPREQFMAAANPPVDKMQPRLRNPDETGSAQSYARMGLRGAGKLYVRIVTRGAGKLERRQLVQRILGAPYYFIRREGGAILVNTSNLMSVSLFPGPAELPPTAWPAHHMAG